MAYPNHLLFSLPSLKDCQQETLDRLLLSAQVFRLRSKESPFHHAAETDDILLQLSGKSFLYSVTQFGHRRVFALVFPGMIVNPGRVSGSPSAVHSEMLEDGEMIAIPRGVFSSCMRRDWALAEMVMGQQRTRIQQMELLLRHSVSSLRGEYRLGSFLLEMVQRWGVRKPLGSEIDMDLSASILGDLLGIPRETASRARKQLAEQGLISVDGKRITILSRDRLAAFLAQAGNTLIHPS